MSKPDTTQRRVARANAVTRFVETTVVYKWVPKDELDKEAIPTGVKKIWALVDAKKGVGKVSKAKGKKDLERNPKNDISRYFK